MLALENSVELDEMLCSIFTNPTSHILGYGFSADTGKFTKTLPHFNFMRKIPQFIEIAEVFKSTQ